MDKDGFSLTAHSVPPYSPSRSPLRSSPMRNRSPARSKPVPVTPCQQSPVRPDSSQRQYADLMARLSSLSSDYSHLEEELTTKTLTLKELSQKIASSDLLVRTLQAESVKAHELHQREIASYKELMEEVRRRNNIVVRKLEQEIHRSQAAAAGMDEKYAKLVTSYKALQSNLELEMNSKALLIDQIEYLTKERDFLLKNSADLGSASDESMVQYPYLGQNSDLSGSDSDGSVHGTQLLSAFIDPSSALQVSSPRPMDALSPLKHIYDSENSMEIALGFQFPLAAPSSHHSMVLPPLPDPAHNTKRQSLPARLKPAEDADFVLSPLKLTSNVNLTCFDGGLPTPQTSATTQKRYSSSKPQHSRYNSHDFFPIKVEFEQPDEQMRSASSPDKDVLSRLASVEEDTGVDDRDQAFMKLNGYDVPDSKRDSFLTTSSKRSSLLTDFNALGNDVTKQEIMTLKFELQSLKLHNEKLLSYIGFELQKQKKNIKKLSSKQNLQAQNIEYSDAKLIEKLRNMLIHKKRILRSVSINPILSTKYSQNRHSSILGPGTGLGIFRSGHDEDDEFVFNSDFINSLNANDCDDYGFLTHESKYDLRVLSRKNQAYLNEQQAARGPKKFHSQTFRPSMDMCEYDGAFADIDEVLFDEMEEDVEDVELWDTGSNHSSSSSELDYTKLNTFNQLRYLIMGKDHFRKSRRAHDPLVDENLKYKFLTIVLGIVIVGFRLTAHPQLPPTHS